MVAVTLPMSKAARKLSPSKINALRMENNREYLSPCGFVLFRYVPTNARDQDSAPIGNMTPIRVFTVLGQNTSTLSQK